MKWKKSPGLPGVQAPISHGHGIAEPHDYVISHRRDEHNVSYRPPGKHEHVGTFTTEREAKAAAAKHAKGSAAAKKSPAQLDREIAAALKKAPKKKHSTSRIGTLPPATLKQRAASLSTPQLMDAARKLAKLTDAASDEACTAILDELQKRTPGDAFDAFVAEIYA